MPRWRVAGRRCSEYSETQRVRAEPLVRFRKIRFSSSKPYPGKGIAVPWVGLPRRTDLHTAEGNFAHRQV